MSCQVCGDPNSTYYLTKRQSLCRCCAKGEPGMVVMVFEDPFTRMNEEGRARLCELVRINPGVPYSEDWMVRFDGEDECFQRTIAWL